jgi:phosphohistidine swiveling domain-containing protein
MSCLAFDNEARLNELRANGFTEQECLDLRSSLIGLTNRIINQKNGFWIDDAKKIELLAIRREKLANSSLNDREKIYWLIEDAKRYGTLPFAGLARAAFISIQLLKSLVSMGILNQREYENFLGSTSSVFRIMIEDQIGLSTKDFLSKYGHLRPGTYDILSPRYDEKPEIYFTDLVQTEHQKHEFVISDSQRGEIKGLISRNGLEIGVDELFDFIKKSIELRELAKFEFTKNVSALIKLRSEFGLRNGLSKEDLSFVNISFFSDLTNTDKDQASLRKHVDLGKDNYNKSNSILLPPLITNTQDIWGFEWPLTLPNFVTKKSVIAECTSEVLTSAITDKIVFIPNADPGFDWIFSHRIAGLVTEWGGANSHMSIRANEMGIPAIIGAGELNFQLWSTAGKLYINCEAETVQIVS